MITIITTRKYNNNSSGTIYKDSKYTDNNNNNTITQSVGHTFLWLANYYLLINIVYTLIPHFEFHSLAV